MDVSPPEPAGSHRHWDARPGGPLRGALLAPLTVVYAFLLASLVALVAVLGPRAFRRRWWWLITVWGRAPLWWHGVRLETAGLERLRAPGPRIVLFNHVSLLDLWVLAATAPPTTVVVYKQEFHRIPGIGHALRALGHIAIDRSDKERALASMAAAGARIRDEGCTVYIAPEGTRSRRGGLQEFKLGAFHLARQTGVPLVPFVMRGIQGVLPMGSFLIRSGRVGVDALEPLEVPPPEQGAEVDSDAARALAGRARAVFLDYLAPVSDD